MTFPIKKRINTELSNNFFVIFASSVSNISASRQNIKNLPGNLRDIQMRNLIAKFELCSFNTEVAL